MHQQAYFIDLLASFIFAFAFRICFIAAVGTFWPNLICMGFFPVM